MSGRLRSPLSPSIGSTELARERAKRNLPPYTNTPRLYVRSEHEGDDRFEALLLATEDERPDEAHSTRTPRCEKCGRQMTSVRRGKVCRLCRLVGG